MLTRHSHANGNPADLFNPEKAVEFVGAGRACPEPVEAARDPLNRGHGPLLHTGFQFARDNQPLATVVWWLSGLASSSINDN
jgi:hypothetical protein